MAYTTQTSKELWSQIRLNLVTDLGKPQVSGVRSRRVERKDAKSVDVER